MKTPDLLSFGSFILLVVSKLAAAAGDGYAGAAPEVESKIPWVAIIYAAVALLGIAVVGFKNAKRFHLD